MWSVSGQAEMLTLLWIAVLSPVVFASVPGCPDNLPDTTTVTAYKGKCYQFVHEEKYWTDARDYCWRYDGALVMINNQDVNDYVTGVIDTLSSWDNNAIWIGLNDKGNELVWKWMTNSQFNWIPLNTSWTNWAPGHPEGFWHSSRDCIRMVRKHKWKWSETPCSTMLWKYRFICQYDQVIPTTPTTEPPPEPKLGYRVGQAEDAMETTSDIVMSTNVMTSETMHEQNMVIEDAAFAALRKDSNRNTNIAVILGTVGAGCFLVAIIIIVIVRSRKRDKETNHIETQIDDQGKDHVKGLDTMTNNNIQGNRSSNIYVSTSGLNNNSEIAAKDDGYLVPNALKNPKILSDTYLTTCEAKSAENGATASGTIQEPRIFIHQEPDKGNLCSAGYLPMNGSKEKVNSAIESGSSTCDKDYEHMYGDGYEVPNGEPIYAEIPEIKPDMEV